MDTNDYRTESQLALEEIVSLVDNSKYVEALDEIRKIRDSRCSSAPRTELARMYYLWSSCLLKLGRYKLAIVKAKVAQRLCRELPDHKLYAEIKMCFGKCLFLLGRMSEALEEFNEAYASYRRNRDAAALLYPLNSMAHIHYLRGDLLRCEEILRECVNYARKYHGSTRILIDTRNMIRVLILRGEFRDVGEALESIKPLHCEESDSYYAAFLSGHRLARLREYDSALQILGSALEGFKKLSMTRDEIVCLEYLGLNEYYAGNYDKAKAYYDDILGRKEITASARAQTLRMLTDVYVAKAMWQQASETAVVAEAAIIKINERIELGALDRARGLISANAGEHDQARDYFDKSIRLLREIGARYELALSYLTCGRCDIFSRDERRYFLRRAHDLFSEMEVPKRVVEVDEALSTLVAAAKPVPELHRGAGVQPDRRLVFKSPAPSGNGQVVIAGSPCMRELMEEIERLASTDLTVLLTGETGTGKDLLAQYLHEHSGRRGEFVTVNSAAIPNEMVEAELFGYAKGAFTGANKDKPGLFELADSGTFYLNEISCCTPEFQAKLLEVLETGMIRRLGETAKRRVDFRLIAASNQDLNRMIREERFRPDLFYRLREYQVALPPLQERREDFPALVYHFLLEAGCPQDGEVLRTHCKQIAKMFAGRPWPGNVRMLRAELRRLWFASDGDLDQLLRLAANRGELSQREELLYALRQCDFNQSETARRLGVSEGTVRNRIKRFRIVRQA